MSREAPRFGDVFEYSVGGGRIMYIGPAPLGAFKEDWIGITICPAETALQTQGEIAQRVPLLDAQSVFAHWTEVTDD